MIQAAVLLKTLTTEKKTNREKKYQLSGDGGNLSLAATLHPLQHWTVLPAKCLPRGPKTADGFWKEVDSWSVGCSHQLLLNKFCIIAAVLLEIFAEGEKKTSWG